MLACFIFPERGIFSTPELLEPVLRPRTVQFVLWRWVNVWATPTNRRMEDTFTEQLMRDTADLWKSFSVYIGMASTRLLVYIGMASTRLLSCREASINNPNCCRSHTLKNVGHIACDINTYGQMASSFNISGNQNASKPLLVSKRFYTLVVHQDEAPDRQLNTLATDFIWLQLSI